MWAVPQLEIEYYLQIAGQAYYHHLSYISDPSVPDGIIFYPWLPFGPAVVLARTLGLTLFSVGPIWMLFGAVGTSAGLYFVFWRFLGQPWLSAALSIFCLSSLRFSASVPLNYQFHAIVKALLLHPYGTVNLSPIPVWEWRRLVDPAFDLPFLFLQIVVVSIARERKKGVGVWLSGLVFGLMFYIYFYMWTLVTAALCLALLLDRAHREIYAWTLLIGLALGVPEVVHLLRLREIASTEALTRFAVLSAAGSEYLPGLPWLSIIAVGGVGLWIWTTSALELTYLWSLAVAGILLGSSPLLTGAFLHAYHWTWLMLPIRMILALIMIAMLAKERLRWLPIFNWTVPTLLVIYLAGGIYLTAITLTRTESGTAKLENYARYRSQRLVQGVNPLAPDSVIAGDDRFTELAMIGENQRALSGIFLNASMVVDDATWRSRFSLNSFLSGTTDRSEFERAASVELETGLWNASSVTPELLAPFMRTYDEVVRDPGRFISAFAVRYVALPVARPAPAYLRNGWTLIQPGPYWQLWERRD